MCSKTGQIQALQPLADFKAVLLPDGSMQSVKEAGTVVLDDNLILQDVLYLTQFKHNLLSINKLLQSKNLELKFLKDHCIIQNNINKLVIVVGFMVNGLYLIMKDSFSSVIKARFQSYVFAAGVTSPIHVSSHLLWHWRLGHPSSVFSSHLQIPKLLSSSTDDICDVGHLSKQRRENFPSHSMKRLDKFELLHVDIWGPYKHKSLAGASYFLTIVDGHLHFIWTYLMEFKSQASKLLEHHIKFLHTQFAGQVKLV